MEEPVFIKCEPLTYIKTDDCSNLDIHGEPLGVKGELDLQSTGLEGNEEMDATQDPVNDEDYISPGVARELLNISSETMLCEETINTEGGVDARWYISFEQQQTCSGERGDVYGTSLNSRKESRRVEKPYSCEICKANFSLKGNLKKHMIIHSGERPYICLICNLSFTQKTSLNFHYRTHTGEKPYVCKTCNKSFSLKGNLTEHEKIHIRQKHLACKVCNFSCSDKSILISHRKSHPYLCIVCNSVFTDRGNFQVHQRIHTGEKRYSCTSCGRAFNHKSNYNTHLRTHTGEKPYLCDICGSTFSRKNILEKHRRNH